MVKHRKLSQTDHNLFNTFISGPRPLHWYTVSIARLFYFINNRSFEKLYVDRVHHISPEVSSLSRHCRPSQHVTSNDLDTFEELTSAMTFPRGPSVNSRGFLVTLIKPQALPSGEHLVPWGEYSRNNCLNHFQKVLRQLSKFFFQSKISVTLSSTFSFKSWMNMMSSKAII